MSKKKFYDEDGNEIRSRPEKPLYKKKRFWLIIVFAVLSGAVGMYILGSYNEVPDEVTKKSIEIEQPKLDETEEENVEEEVYTYEDFKGTYVKFTGEPYNSPIGMSEIIVLNDDTYQSFDRWELNMTSTILDKTIEGDMLTLDLDSDENEMWGLHSESGTEQFKLQHDGDTKHLYSMTSNESLYSMSSQDLQTHYTQSEIDYARIIMTLRGVPPLDFWAVFSSEYDGKKPLIGVSHNKKGDIIPYTDDDVEYPEDVTDLYSKNKSRQDEISFTYSSIEDGYIRVYPIPLNHAIKTGKEVIDGAEEKNIKSFEPYEVADFIGNVEFDKE